ncbi:MAG TPA: fructose-bisphosphatase class II, partial [Gaiellaceae bacterium]
MTEAQAVEPEGAPQEEQVARLPEPRACLCESYLRATERAALAGARWLGRADQESAEEASVSGMRTALDELPMAGRVMIGAGDGDTSMPDTLGAGGIDVDLALDPLEGRGVVARGG